MAREANGYFSAQAESAAAGTRYRFLLNGEEAAFPDPASRFQPEGPNFASEVIDQASFQWTDREWLGPREEDQVIYEMHIGTFTREGTWSAATAQLEELSRLGISVLEVMPVAEFMGNSDGGTTEWTCSRRHAVMAGPMSFDDLSMPPMVWALA